MPVIVMSRAIQFPSRVDSQARARQSLDLPEPRVWKLKHLTEFLGVSASWVYKRTAIDAEDPIPRMPGVGRLSFDTHLPAFRAWIARQLGYVDKGAGNE